MQTQSRSAPDRPRTVIRLHPTLPPPPAERAEPPDELAGPGGAELAAEMLRRMLRIRRFEEATIALFEAGELPAMVHLSIGQEAATAGACLATDERDTMTGNHRSHGHPIAKGADLKGLMAELLGKAGGVCGGKGGSMHLADFSVGSLGESGIVGSAIPVATGAGLSAQVLGTGSICLCFFGDGAASEGVLHESMNIAAVWRLPVVYFCENNGYAVSVEQATALSVPDVAARAAGYGIPGVVVDGQDVVATYAAVRDAVARARRGEGPTLVEAKTYRFHEHAYGLKLSAEYLDAAVVQELARHAGPDRAVRGAAGPLGPARRRSPRRDRRRRRRRGGGGGRVRAREPYPPAEDAYRDLYAEPWKVAR